MIGLILLVVNFKCALIIAQVVSALTSIHHFHKNGPCNLWWPLNNTDVHILPSSIEFSTFLPNSIKINMDIVIACPALASDTDDLSFESLVNIEMLHNGNIRAKRAGMVLRIEQQDHIISDYDVSTYWNIANPLITSFVLKNISDARPVETLHVSLHGTDGAIISMFANLHLNIVDISVPRWIHSNQESEVNKNGDCGAPQCHGAKESNVDVDSVDNKHAFTNLIPNRDVIGEWIRLLLPQHILKMRAVVLAEVGVRRGEFSLDTMLRGCGTLCRHWLLVDIWDQQTIPTDEYIDIVNKHTDRRVKLSKDGEDHKFVQNKAKRISELSDITVTIEKSESVQVAEDLRINSKARFWNDIDSNGSTVVGKRTIDFVYLDARHDYQSVVEDICAWFPLVSPGGILAGHDYVQNRYLYNTLFTVRQAVDKFAFDLGVQLHVTGEPVESFPTWFVYRPRLMTAKQRLSFNSYCSHLNVQ